MEGRGATRLRGHLRPPRPERLAALAEAEHFHFGQPELSAFGDAIANALRLVDVLDEYPAPTMVLRHHLRDPGGPPSPEANPHNVFIRVCHVPGADSGPLENVRVGVKDNIAVAGVPLTDGARTTPYVPLDDAVVVERLLDAGATVVGKLNMDDLGSAGTGETSTFGPVPNPVDPTKTAGGSSSGAAAAVVLSIVDLAIGIDQGGSARIPAAYCGAVALKPTHGLVPSYGVTHIDHTLDAVSPVAASVELVARTLDVIGGDDPRDPQWVRGPITPPRCKSQLDSGVRGLTIGVIEEALADGDPATLEGLERAKRTWAAAGAEVVSTSVPTWRIAWPLEVAILSQLAWSMAQSEGQGWGHLGRVDVERARHVAAVRRLEADDYPPFYKLWMLLGRYLHEEYLGQYLGKATNLRALLTGEIDRALEGCDLLVTPTTRGPAPELAVPPVSEMSLLGRGTPMSGNTCPLNLSGHPALAVPSGTADGLPVSVQIIAPRFEDARTLRAGRLLHE